MKAGVTATTATVADIKVAATLYHTLDLERTQKNSDRTTIAAEISQATTASRINCDEEVTSNSKLRESAIVAVANQSEI